MKDKIMNLLKQPSTWRGVIMFFGGISGIASTFLDPHIVALVDSVVIAISGAIGMTTNDYAKTPNQLDDIGNAIANGVLSSKK